MIKDLSEKLKSLPDKPGVYVMLDENNEIIYVGKAKVLKNRVRQYFQSPKNLTAKVIAMVNKINDFYYYIVNTEGDALVLESNLIKKYKPQYNVLLKDDKNYPYIRINKKEDFPKVEICRKLKKDGASYFGPYMGNVSVKDLMNVIYEGFHVKSCSININKIPKDFRPCMEEQISRCVAPCINKVTKEEYDEIIEDVIKFLKGDTERVEKLLQDKMELSASQERFERAIVIREMLKVVNKIKEKKLTALPKNIDMDIFTFATNGVDRVINRLMIRQGRMQGGENYTIVDFASSGDDVLASFVLQYYDKENIPEEIILSVNEELSASIKYALKDKTYKAFNVISPKTGIRKSLIEMGEQNALDFMEKSVDKIRTKENMTVNAVKRLSKYLSIPNIRRMECYDISNISGTDKVASMVVFIDGEKEGKHYRKYKIKTVEGANDFASMKEVLVRRLIRLKNNDEDISFGSKPDLIVVDGGKGQLSYAVSAMEELGIDIPIISLAKKEEEVFLPNRENPVIIPKNDNALKLLQRIRDESHRFAITFHRNLRNKNSLQSQLEKINGIGKEKKKELLLAYKTVSSIKNATEKDLTKVNGIGDKLAKEIYDYFHKGESQ